MSLHGIDLSNHNDVTEGMTAIQSAENAFVIIKASEGEHTTDSNHAAFLAAGRAARKLVGHYHFGHPVQNATQEADFFVSQAKARAGELLVLDLEAVEGTPIQRVSYAIAFLARVKATTGARPVLYSYTSYLASMLAAASASQKATLRSYPLWVADPSAPTGQPNMVGWPTWTLHQYGISGGIDQNMLNGDSKTWAALAVPGAPVPQPPVRPVVDLSNVVAAAKRDPSLPQGGTTYKADALVVEKALVAEQLLDATWADGSFGTRSRAAYAALQRRYGYSGADADGVPGMASLTKLGKVRGFTVKA